MSCGMLRKAVLCGLSLVPVAAVGRVYAQDAAAAGGAERQRGQFGGGQFAGMQRAAGEIVAVSGATLSIKTETGATMQVITTDNTRVLKGRPGQGGQGSVVKVADLRIGDGIVAMGNLDAPNKTIHAAILVATDAAQVKALKDNLGKTYIAGKVMGIDMDNAKLTVLRSDGVSQTIGLDESTSFRRGRANMGMALGMAGQGEGGGRQRGGDAAAAATAESITLADIKVGDTIGGRGTLKGGVFVPSEVVVATPGQRRQRAGSTDAAAPNTPQ